MRTSKLIPYHALIVDCVERGYSAPKIADVLSEQAGLIYDPSTINHYLSVRGLATKERRGKGRGNGDWESLM